MDTVITPDGTNHASRVFQLLLKREGEWVSERVIAELVCPNKNKDYVQGLMVEVMNQATVLGYAVERWSGTSIIFRMKCTKPAPSLMEDEA